MDDYIGLILAAIILAFFSGLGLGQHNMLNFNPPNILWYVEVNNGQDHNGTLGLMNKGDTQRVVAASSVGYSDINVSLGWDGTTVKVYIDQTKEQ